MLFVVLMLVASSHEQYVDSLTECFEHREAVKSGHLRISSTELVGSHVGREISYEFWFKGKKFRQDLTVRLRGQVIYEHEFFDAGNWVIDRPHYIGPKSDGRMSLRGARMDDDPGTTKLRKEFLFPMTLGLNINQFDINTDSLAVLKGEVTNTGEFQIESSVNADSITYTLNRSSSGEKTKVVTVVPSMAYCITNQEVYSSGKLLVRLVNSPKSFAGVWFPGESVYEKFDNSGKLTDSYKTVTEMAEFNQDIPDGVFSLASLDAPVPIGTLVVSVSNTGRVIGEWDGNSLVDRNQKSPQSSSSVFRYALLGVGLLLLGVAVFQVAKSLRS